MFPSQSVLAAQLSNVAHYALAATTAAKPKNSSAGVFIIIALFIGVFYFFLIRPQRRRAQAAAATQSEIEPGQKVLTRHGQIAYVVELDGDEIVLEIAPGVHSRFVKEAVARVIPPPEPDEGITDPDDDPSYNELPDDPEPDADHSDHHHSDSELSETEVHPDPDTDTPGL